MSFVLYPSYHTSSYSHICVVGLESKLLIQSVHHVGFTVQKYEPKLTWSNINRYYLNKLCRRNCTLFGETYHLRLFSIHF